MSSVVVSDTFSHVPSVSRCCSPPPFYRIMTLTNKGGNPAKQLDSSHENEEVPSYEEATSQQNQGSSSDVPNVNMYPFPSLGTQRGGYGQSPYQSDGTLRIVIQQAPVPHVSRSSQAFLLPLPATTERRGPRAGRRFCYALFWALILYCIFTMATGMVIGHLENKRGTNSPPTGGPPGWHHHHDDVSRPGESK